MYSRSLLHELNMAEVNTQTMQGNRRLTYFGHLSLTGQMPTAIKALIDRYDIRIYDEVYEDVELDPLPPTENLTNPDLVNCSTNNNDDDVEPVQSSPQMPVGGSETSVGMTKVVRQKLPSLTRRLSKLGRRPSSDKNKMTVESPSPSDSQLAEGAVSSDGTSTTAVDDSHLQAADTCDDEQKSNYENERKEKYQEGNYKESNENVTAIAYTSSIVVCFHFLADIWLQNLPK